MRILVVDDSPTAAFHLRSKLLEMGHEVVMAKSAGEAWQHLQVYHESLIITDWTMPGMSGPEFCQRVRARGNTPYTYIILLTVKELRKDRLQGLQAGADGFLSKPVDSIELAATLQSAQRILSVQIELQKRVAELERASNPLEFAQASPVL
jgi:sigma-B regulation protein RsbU (phosphoserine phosphatase)